MDKQQTKMKPKNLERYKSGESKFLSLEQSRQLRALQKRQQQKHSRDEILNKIRGATADTPQAKSGSQQMPGTSSTQKLSRSELKELGTKRYHEMLKWKEQRRKLLEHEKKARKPSFKTGVVQPDQPQYLQDVYVEKKDPSTPFKFNVVSRDSIRKSVISSVTKENNLFGRNSSRSLSFHTGVTPQTSGTAASSSSKIFGSRRATRVFRPPPDVGIAPLPKTPSLGMTKAFPRTPGLRAPSRSFNILKESKSFAPNIFSFKAPEGLQRYNIKHSSGFQSVCDSISKKEELDFAKEVSFQNFNDDGTEKEDSAENLQNEELERSSLRETFMIENVNKGNKIETNDEELDPQEVFDSEEKLQIDEDNGDTEIVEEIPQLEENLEEEGSDNSFEIEMGSNLNDKSNHEDYIEAEPMECPNDDENLDVQDFKFELPEVNEDCHADALPVEEEREELSEVLGENDENTTEENDDLEELSSGTEKNIAEEKDGLSELVSGSKENIAEEEDELSEMSSGIKENIAEEEDELSEMSRESKENIAEEEDKLSEMSSEGNENVAGGKERNFKPEDEMDIKKMGENLENDKEVGNEVVSIKSSTKRRYRSLSQFTPPMAKLRPRTPCSRSTRRSHLAHCDTPCFSDNHKLMKTPGSRRKSSRKSLAITSSIKKAVNEPAEDFVAKTIPDSSAAFKTPSQNSEDDKSKITPLSQERLDQLENSPWITRSRGSDSSKSSKRKSIFDDTSEKELKAEHLDILEKSPWISKSRGTVSSKSLKRKRSLRSASDSPILSLDCDVVSVRDLMCDGGSPQLKRGSWLSISREKSPPPFKVEPSLPVELVQQQQTDRNTESPDVSVWGPDSAANSPMIAKTEEPDDDNTSKTKVTLNPESKSLKPKRRSSKRVSLLVDFDKETSDDASNIKYPVTPRRTSFRTSSTGNQRVSLLPGLYPHDENTETSSNMMDENTDLISLDSPAIAPFSGGKRKSSKSRLSQRVSLLPGLSSHPEEEDDESSQSHINEEPDLISWDSPAISSGRKKSKKKSNADTPLRRSRRVSKI